MKKPSIHNVVIVASVLLWLVFVYVIGKSLWDLNKQFDDLVDKVQQEEQVQVEETETGCIYKFQNFIVGEEYEIDGAKYILTNDNREIDTGYGLLPDTYTIELDFARNLETK